MAPRAVEIGRLTRSTTPKRLRRAARSVTALGGIDLDVEPVA